MALQPFQHPKPEQEEQSAQPSKPAQHHQAPQFDPDPSDVTPAHSMMPKPFKEPKEGREYKEPKTPQHYQTPQSPAPVLSFAYDGLDGSGNEQWRLIITLEGDYASGIDPDTCQYRIVRLLGNGPDGFFDAIIDTPGEFAFLSFVGEDFSSQVTVVEGRAGWLDSAQRTASRPRLILELSGDNAPSGSVALWADSSVFGNDATQATSGLRPTRVSAAINGHAAVEFDGSDDRLDFPEMALNDFSLYVVINQTGDKAILGLVANAINQIRIGESGNRLATFDGTHNPTSDLLDVTQGSWSLVGYARSGDTVTFRQCGISYGTGTMTAPGSFDSIGAFQGSFNCLAGRIAHLKLFRVYHDDAERESIEDALGLRYGITITH